MSSGSTIILLGLLSVPLVVLFCEMGRAMAGWKGTLGVAILCGAAYWAIAEAIIDGKI